MKKGLSRFLYIMSVIADVFVKIFGRSSVPSPPKDDKDNESMKQV